MRRSFKFLLRPTAKQAQALAAMLADHCSLYNAALQERRDAYRHPSKTTVRYGEQSGQLKDIRACDPDQARWSFSSQQATLRRLDKAFQAFFRRVKAGQTPGYPRFRSRIRFDTVEFPKDGDGCRWDSTAHEPVTRVRLQGVGHVRVHQHRSVRGVVKTVSVTREGARWFVVLSCDEVPAEPLPTAGRQAGIDMGVTHLLTTSTGVHVPNPQHARQAAAALTAAQQHLATFPRCKPGNRTRRHRVAAAKVARLHAKVRRQRLDHHHKIALGLIREFGTIAHEDLNTAGLTRTPKPAPDPDHAGAFLPNGANAKAGLNRSILDAGWAQFLTILASKAESAGRHLIAVNPRNTSRTCPRCTHTDPANRPSQARFHCQRCGHAGHADTTAAINIAIRAGLVLPDVA